MVELSVIVVNTNQRELLRQCLLSLRQAELPAEHEILVVDNASRDGSQAMVRQDFPEVRLLEQDRRRGPAANYNAGFRAGRGRVLIGLNEDAEVTRSALMKLYRCLVENARVGCAAPRLQYPDGTPQLSCGRFPSWSSSFKRLLLQKFFRSHWANNTYAQEQKNQPFEPDWVMATSLAYRREVFEQLGFYDEQFVIYYEEVEMAQRLRQAGWSVRWLPEALINHHHGVSNLKLRSSRDIYFRRLLYQSRYRYFRKVHGLAYAGLVRALEAALFAAIWLSNRLRRQPDPLKLSLYSRLFGQALGLARSLQIPQPDQSV